MNRPIRAERTLSLLTAALTAMAVCSVVSDTLSKTHDMLSETPDILSKIPNTLTDKRDGKTYKVVKMPDGNVWMAENLNYQTDSSWCYKNKTSYCDVYGRLYNWNAAITACPAGWHLPTRQEWDSLVLTVGGYFEVEKEGVRYWGSIGKLKSKNYWNHPKIKGTDDYGFSALPGSYRGYLGRFGYINDDGNWWTATEHSNRDAYYRNMEGWNNGMSDYNIGKSYGFSVRCVMDRSATGASSQKSVGDDKANIKIEMVFVKGGTFMMGCTGEQGSDCDDYEKPAHSVTVSDFYIGKYEVTQNQWVQVMGSSNNRSYFKGGNLPVEQVDWNDAQKFILQLNTMTGKKYRLPTEAEWEYAARGGASGKGYKYSGSNSGSDVAWYNVNSGDKVLRDGLFEEYSDKNDLDGYHEVLSSNKNRTRAVGTKAPNELGIYDMSGNVWEWVNDWYGEYSSATQTNPRGPSSGAYSVLRGGSWYNDAGDCRVSNRGGYDPGYGVRSLGFRLALSP